MSGFMKANAMVAPTGKPETHNRGHRSLESELASPAGEIGLRVYAKPIRMTD
jgi:hypothetical protein